MSTSSERILSYSSRLTAVFTVSSPKILVKSSLAFCSASLVSLASTFGTSVSPDVGGLVANCVSVSLLSVKTLSTRYIYFSKSNLSRRIRTGGNGLPLNVWLSYLYLSPVPQIPRCEHSTFHTFRYLWGLFYHRYIIATCPPTFSHRGTVLHVLLSSEILFLYSTFLKFVSCFYNRFFTNTHETYFLVIFPIFPRVY